MTFERIAVLLRLYVGLATDAILRPVATARLLRLAYIVMQAHRRGEPTFMDLDPDVLAAAAEARDRGEPNLIDDWYAAR